MGAFIGFGIEKDKFEEELQSLVSEPIKDEELMGMFDSVIVHGINLSEQQKKQCVEVAKKYASSIQNNSAGVWVKAKERLPKTKGHYITKRPTLNEGERIIKDEIFNPKYSYIGEKWISFRYEWLDESKQK